MSGELPGIVLSRQGERDIIYTRQTCDTPRRSPTPSKMEDENKVKGARSVNDNETTVYRSAATPLHVDRRFWPRDMRGVIKVYEQSTLLQESMKSQCQETTRAFEDLSTACVSTIRQLMEQLDTILIRIEEERQKPANVIWTPVLDALRKFDDIQPEAVQAAVTKTLIDQLSTVEDRLKEKFSEAITGMEKIQRETEAKHRADILQLREEVKSTRKKAEEIELVVKTSEDKIFRAIDKNRTDLQGDFTKGLQGMLDAQDNTAIIRPVLCGIEPLLEIHVTQKVCEGLQSVKTTMFDHIQDVMTAQEQHTIQVLALEPHLNTQLGMFFETAKNREEASRHQIKEVHTSVHDELAYLFTEIGVIQKALNLDFVAKPQWMKPLRDGLRLREFMTQTDSKSLKEIGVQTDEIKPKKKEPKKYVGLSPKALFSEQKKTVTSMFNRPKETTIRDIEKKKKLMREALIKPGYNVANFYHREGCAQLIAKSSLFEHLTFIMILANALWIAVDTDYNDAVLLIDADRVFQIVENLFCLFFTLELLIRFAAFKSKRYCLRDTWFVFDGTLVFLMVLETWVINAIILILSLDTGAGSGLGSLSILRMVKIAKLVRVARMARILRMIPELVVIVRSVASAFRSVVFFLLLTISIVYVFGLMFRQITKDTDVGRQYFGTVPRAMGSLLVEGMIPIYSKIINDVSRAHPMYWVMIMAFILMASVAVMNMLIGVLVEVVRTVSEKEKEAITVVHVTNELRELMAHFMKETEEDRRGKLSFSESGDSRSFGSRSTMTRRRRSLAVRFLKKSSAHSTVFEEQMEPIPNMPREDFEYFLGLPEVVNLLADCGVDACALLDSTDMIFEEKAKDGNGLRFPDFVEVVLGLRGTNPATVKDVKEQIRLIKINTREAAVDAHDKIAHEIKKLGMDIAAQIIDLKRALESEAESEEEDSMRKDTGDPRRDAPSVRSSHEFPPDNFAHLRPVRSMGSDGHGDSSVQPLPSLLSDATITDLE